MATAVSKMSRPSPEDDGGSIYPSQEDISNTSTSTVKNDNDNSNKLMQNKPGQSQPQEQCDPEQSNPAQKKTTLSGDDVFAPSPSDESQTRISILEAVASNLIPISPDQEANLALPPLTYKPNILSPKALWASFVYHVALFGILTASAWMKEITILSDWAYVAIKILPLALGTISSEIILAYLLSISMISPYMKCATTVGGGPEGSKTHEKGSKRGSNTAACTILFGYFPFPSRRRLFWIGDWLLFSSAMLFILAMNLSPIKASLFDIDEGDELVGGEGEQLLSRQLRGEENIKAKVQLWAAYTLMGIYGCVVIYVGILLCYFRNRTTGLRWCPGSFASMLALFHHSDFLHCFEGSCIATRRSMTSKLGGLCLRLGYWQLPDGRAWHGFGLDPTTTNEETNSLMKLSAKEEPEVRLSAKKVSAIRYNETYWVLRKPSVIFFATLCFLVSFGYFFMILKRWDDPELNPTFMKFLIVIIFEFIPTLIATCMTFYLEDVAQIISALEPFVQMSISTQSSSTLESTALLNYRHFRPRVICLAFYNGNWRVFFINLIASAQRGLPMLVGTAVTVHDGTNTVQLSRPMFVLIGIWFLMYAIALPIILLRRKEIRMMPRTFRCLGDVLSLACSSSLLNAREVRFSDKEDSTHRNPFDIPTGARFTERHLEGQLLLYGKDCGMGLYNPHGSQDSAEETMGFDWAERVTYIPITPCHKHCEAGIHNGERTSILSANKVLKTPNSTSGHDAAAKATRDVEEVTPSSHIIARAGRFQVVPTTVTKRIWSDLGHLCGQACAVAGVDKGAAE